MKKTIGFISLLALSITNSIAGVIPYSKLSEGEKEFIISNLDNNLIQYDATTDDVIIDKELEKQLREAGILEIQAGIKNSVCGGDEG